MPVERSEPKQVYVLYQASGGAVAVALSFSNVPSGANIKIEAKPQNKLAMAVNEICSAFGLTKEELAQVCMIHSRKTLYNWINGETVPRTSTMNRIYDLLLAARDWVGSGLSINREQLHTPVLNDQCVFDLLNAQQIDRERILFAGSRVNMLSTMNSNLSNPFA